MKKDERKGIRVEVDARNEKIGYKIREAQLSQIPYMLVVGDKEIESEKVAVRSRDKGELGAVSVEAFIDDIVEEIGKSDNYIYIPAFRFPAFKI